MSGNNHRENGNILLIVLVAIVMIGVLTAAIQSTSRPEGTNIDSETLALNASRVQQYMAELERAVVFIIQNGTSETDIRFAHPDINEDYGDLSDDFDPSNKVFHPEGGAALYRAPPPGINDGSHWEFYGSTRAPAIGSSRPELMAVLPNVNKQFCLKINELNDQPREIPFDNAQNGCINEGPDGRFREARQFLQSGNLMEESSFAQDTVNDAPRPAPQACVRCSNDTLHFYHVLLAR